MNGREQTLALFTAPSSVSDLIRERKSLRRDARYDQMD